jgi:WD40 repeat protein
MSDQHELRQRREALAQAVNSHDKEAVLSFIHPSVVGKWCGFRIAGYKHVVRMLEQLCAPASDYQETVAIEEIEVKGDSARLVVRRVARMGTHSQEDRAQETWRLIDGRWMMVEERQRGGSLEKAIKWVKRRPVVAALLAAVLLVTVGGITWLANNAPIQTLVGHGGAVSSLALSSDGKRLFSGDADKTIKVWDLEAGEEILTLRGHTNAVTRLALSADGKRLCSGSFDKTIKVWDLEAGKDTLTLRWHTYTSSLALSADGKRLFSGSDGNTIKVWDLDTGKDTLTLRGHTGDRLPGGIESLALSADGKRLFSGSFDKTIKVWDLEAGKDILTLRGHTGPVYRLALSADGKRLFSSGGGTRGKTIMVWDLEADVLRIAMFIKDIPHRLGLVGPVPEIAIFIAGVAGVVFFLKALRAKRRQWRETITIWSFCGGAVAGLFLVADSPRWIMGLVTGGGGLSFVVSMVFLFIGLFRSATTTNDSQSVRPVLSLSIIWATIIGRS